ncbi:DUF2255 family protein [Gracilibacillus salinarum]|uniref:DUF2255 family protein n=1 Tax=Gracilibacillus salinarum TaxID=2932255 RepID=A0ABY4GKK9_9BACI|nr:DUF2255 family protein [Gracilibacillus salinarum]UOQ84705.1 DUF2255 family protein [Gracilibacillus salinarum]
MESNWTEEQLNVFSRTDDLYISPFYSDGKTPGTPTWIWSVVADHHLYVRAYNGQHSSWYQSALAQQTGKISIAGQEYDVTFQPTERDPALTKKIDQAYEEKYSNSNYLSPMLGEGPVSATVKISPRH